MSILDHLCSIVLLSPIFLFVSFATAFLTATLLVRYARPNDVQIANHTTSIDGLRAFLALGVFVHHQIVNYHYIQSQQWLEPEANIYNEAGRGSVVLFFMITAYLFWGKIQKSTLNWTSLFTGRVFRLAPMYLLTIAIMVFLCMCFSDFKIVVSLRTLAEQIILWMLFTMLGHPDINNIEHTHLIVAGVTWTLVYEWLFYLSLPIMALLFTKHRNPLTIALSVICSTVIIVLDRTYIHSRFSRMIPFLGGIAAAYWVADARRRELARKPVATIIAISALIFTFTFYHTSFSPFPILLLSITFVAVASGNDCFGLLKLKPVVWLGEISYSIYLLHGIIVTLLLRKCYFANSPSSYLFGTIVACVILVVSSSFTYIYVEKPGIELGRLIMSWIRPLEKRA